MKLIRQFRNFSNITYSVLIGSNIRTLTTYNGSPFTITYDCGQSLEYFDVPIRSLSTNQITSIMTNNVLFCL